MCQGHSQEEASEVEKVENTGFLGLGHQQNFILYCADLQMMCAVSMCARYCPANKC